MFFIIDIVLNITYYSSKIIYNTGSFIVRQIRGSKKYTIEELKEKINMNEKELKNLKILLNEYK